MKATISVLPKMALLKKKRPETSAPTTQAINTREIPAITEIALLNQLTPLVALATSVATLLNSMAIACRHILPQVLLSNELRHTIGAAWSTNFVLVVIQNQP